MNDAIQLTRQENEMAVLTFNRPEALNALTLAAMEGFQQAVYSLVDDVSLRAVIITGAGSKAFCSGGDLVELSHHETEEGAKHFIGLMSDALLHLERLPVPVIAAINGFALGGGSEISLACDMRIVDADVKMGMVQINNGLTPGWGAGQRLLRIVGYSQAMELLLKGTILRVDDLVALHLVNEVAPAGKAFERARQFADEIANRPPQVVRGIKTLLQAGMTHSYEEAHKIEQDLFPPLWVDDPHIQAVRRFLKRQEEKRRTSSKGDS
ncbi:MAG: enoyl-CoA hydratase/isomerase family protein [Anaerolineae bacterium]|nr:enoyl-CoA hydratase/isomerase family protein [Anaerolineae bacterium]